MVVTHPSVRVRKCERCGALPSEAKLTVSHCPQTAIGIICGKRGWAKKQVRYTLCRMCHDVWTQMEKVILRNAMAEMEKMHEEYLNQPNSDPLPGHYWISYKFLFGVSYPVNKRTGVE